VISRVQDPHTQANIAKAFGIEDILPALQKSQVEWDKLKESVRQAGAVMGGSALKEANDYEMALNKLSLTASTAANVFGSKFTPLLNWMAKDLQRGIDSQRPAYRSTVGSWGDDAPSTGGASGGWGDEKPGAAGGHGTVEKQALLKSLEARYGLPAGLLQGVWGTESSFGANTGLSSAGASGNFQFMPSTAAQYGVTVGDFASEAEGAAKYLQDLHAQRGSWSGALMGYNGVVNNVDKGEKYVNDVARNSGSDQVKILVDFKNVPRGVTPEAKTASGVFVPTRIGYTMPTGGLP
jgi:soluble lytic murein transglycosylase-like protein